MATETSHLYIVASLLMKAHSDEPVLDVSKRIIRLLQNIMLFPELASLRDEMQALLDEAKCQVRTRTVCVCCVVHWLVSVHTVCSSKGCLAKLQRCF